MAEVAAQSFALRVPMVDFVAREETDEMPGFGWVTKTSADIFAGRRVAVFASARRVYTHLLKHPFTWI